MRSFLSLACFIGLSAISRAQPSMPAGPYDRPSGDPHQSRSTVIATEGMVATSHPLAASVGVDVLKAGGNAVDAAIATNAMLGLVEPMSCGIGGDLFVIYWDSKTQKLYGLNASGRSPYGISREVFAQRGLTEIPVEGPLAWSLPGCVDGWFELHGRFGSKPFSEILGPAISYGKRGFPVTEIIAGYWKGAEDALAKYPDSAKTFLLDGHAPSEGDVMRNENLARSYEQIAEGGRDAFYRGSIAERIVRFSESHDGFFSLKDFADHTSTWVDPVSTTYRGYEVWELPPNGQGIAALEMLNLLGGYDIAAMGRQSAQYLHTLVEAKKLAFADRAKFYSDPDFNDLPVRELISPAYARRQRERIDPERAATDVPAGDPQLQHGDTIYLTVVDKDRNCCSFIQSNYYGFGSKVTPGDVGFALQNRGALFALSDEHFNRLEPHKRPFHTIIPAMVTKDEKPWLCFGVMGGDMQPQGHVQVLVNLIDFGLNVQAAGDAPRIRHVGSAQPTGSEMEAGGGTVNVESGIPEMAIRGLLAKGHRVARVVGGFGGYQAIQIDWERGTLHGASEPRKDGIALGY
ncbi:gamma-glutamyltransferase [Roseiconus nitratireducens]|uniref:Glutathione hydrolase proenzyme n=1 Tax=Roseiconus nitratireducens TaxID=2605748 RepID=A0A5M6D4W6_9BACT|nr:gamma-glutamyltransferase [Roseiconus nitratireducens]KAA5541352.1 gamma-glutamyltransferase [Roseiconus nitratireducens]